MLLSMKQHETDATADTPAICGTARPALWPSESLAMSCARAAGVMPTPMSTSSPSSDSMAVVSRSVTLLTFMGLPASSTPFRLARALSAHSESLNYTL